MVHWPFDLRRKFVPEPLRITRQCYNDPVNGDSRCYRTKPADLFIANVHVALATAFAFDRTVRGDCQESSFRPFSLPRDHPHKFGDGITMQAAKSLASGEAPEQQQTCDGGESRQRRGLGHRNNHEGLSDGGPQTVAQVGSEIVLEIVSQE